MPLSITPGDLSRLGLLPGETEELSAAIAAMGDLAPEEQWRRLVQDHLTPGMSFAVRRYLFETVYAAWDDAAGPRPAWLPDPDCLATSNIGALMVDRGLDGYRDLHRWSIRERDAFWRVMIERLGIRFQEPPISIRDPHSDPEAPVWLPGARLNIADSCFQADDEAPAIVFPDREGKLIRMAYSDLEKLSGRVANGLLAAGFEPGDAIAVIMPMTVESVAIYLGIVRAGCVVVSISDSFAAEEISMRLRITGAKGIFTQDHFIRGGKRIGLYERMIEAGAPRAIVIGEDSAIAATLERGIDCSWEGFLSDEPVFVSVASAPDAATNLLFSSGTTGEPKVIPWTQTTPIKCAADAWLHHDIHPGDVLAWPTNLGWMMGPWLIFAALVNRATIALYTDAPGTRAFGRFVQDARVTMLGLVPSMVRAWRESGCMEGLDWSRIRVFSSTGECSNTEDMFYLMGLAGYRPVIEYCGGTEIGGAYLTGTVVQPSSPATFTTPALGVDFDLVDESGEKAQTGEVLLIPPSIGLSNILLNTDHHQVYFDGVRPTEDGRLRRRHGDQVERLRGGYFRHHGRADDTMNLGGIKVSSAEIERVLNRVPGVHETAAIAVPPEGGGPDRLVVFLVIESDPGDVGASWQVAFQQAIREHLNPLFRVSDVIVVDSLPRTASNKVMRRYLRKNYTQT